MKVPCSMEVTPGADRALYAVKAVGVGAGVAAAEVSDFNDGAHLVIGELLRAGGRRPGS